MSDSEAASLEAGDSIPLVSYSDAYNTFDTLQLPPAPAGLAWQPVYAEEGFSLLVVEDLPGDFNRDGQVDAADYVVWRNEADAAGWSPADANGDSAIDAGDLAVWKAHYGATAASTASTSVVPEPLSLWLAGAVSAFGACRAVRC